MECESKIAPLSLPKGWSHRHSPHVATVVWLIYLGLICAATLAMGRLVGWWLYFCVPIAGLFPGSWIPILVCSRQHQSILKPVIAELAARQCFPADFWGDSRRANFAQYLAETLAGQLGWGNGRLIPADPFELVIYCPRGDGLEFLTFMHAIERDRGIKIKGKLAFDDHGLGISPPGLKLNTFGEFVDLCLIASPTTNTDVAT